MTINVHLWGPNPPQEQLKILNTFNSPAKLQGAFKMGQDACLSVLTGIVNHMAPGGDCSGLLSCPPKFDHFVQDSACAN